MYRLTPGLFSQSVSMGSVKCVLGGGGGGGGGGGARCVWLCAHLSCRRMIKNWAAWGGGVAAEDYTTL